jgi:predicted nuclease of restriction endonuclease-like (RecB) superfamily
MAIFNSYREQKMGKVISIDTEYEEWLASIESRIMQNRLAASVCVNTEMLKLYWSIGADIADRHTDGKWDSGVAWKLSQDLRKRFNFQIGFTERNLKYMKRFYLFYANLQATNTDNIGNDETPFPQLLGSVPWGHHIEIIAHCKTIIEAMFYIRKTIKEGWGIARLRRALKEDLYSVQMDDVGRGVN